ncbi:hypothetical protein QFC20_007482 [Naganishia adeliensis]|uniref:Uncharacterized protein n=1 Tax=Naganishia adeliensis TaxID=92952 RepID=A0ACC2V006_9TREE|nr:hypothetical protein QFC20_007482 [Naganishia adeliensis]
MVKTKDSTAQKKPAGKKATTKLRAKKALLPPQLARSASLQVKYDVAQENALPTSTIRKGTLAPSDASSAPAATSNLQNLTEFTGESAGTFGLQATEPTSTTSQNVQLPRVIGLVAQDGSPRSKSASLEGWSSPLHFSTSAHTTFPNSARNPPSETLNSEKTPKVPEAETDTVVDWRKDRDAAPRAEPEAGLETGAKGRSVRFCDGVDEGKERGKGIRWEGRAERKRLKGKGKAKEPTTPDGPTFQLASSQTHHYAGQPNHSYAAQDYSSSGLPMVPSLAHTAPCLYQPTTPQALPGIASFESQHAGVEYLTRLLALFRPGTTNLRRIDATRSVPHDPGLPPVYQREFGMLPDATDRIGYQLPDVRHAAASGSLPGSQSGTAQTFPVSDSSSSSTCASRQGDQGLDGGKQLYEAVSRPAMQQQQLSAMSPSQTASTAIDPALTGAPPAPIQGYPEAKPLVKIEPSEHVDPIGIAPPSMHPPAAAPPIFFPPPGVSVLEYFTYHVSPLCPLEELDFAFYFACCWDGGESMIRSTCALYQQWVSASLQRTEELVNYFLHNQQLILVRIRYFRTIRECRLTFNPANRKCDNCFGTSPTLPLPKKDQQAYRYIRLCKDCGEAMCALQEDMMFRTYTLERRRMVELHEKAIRQELKEMGFPVDGGGVTVE